MVDGLELVRDSAPDVAKFQADLAGQLALNGEVERVNRVGPEIRIQGVRHRRSKYCCTQESPVGAASQWAPGLGQSRPLKPDAVGPTRKAVDGWLTRSAAWAATGGEVLVARGLDETEAQQRYQHLGHTVQAAVLAAIAAANDRIFMAEDLARHRITVEARAPGRGDARAEFAIVRVVGVLLPVAGIGYRGKADFGIVHLACQRRALASRQVGR